MAATESNSNGAFINFDDLPKAQFGEILLLQWKGFWLVPDSVNAAISIETQFNPLPSDIILISFPKTGTTWLKALTVSILNTSKTLSQHDPLITHSPHELVPFLEIETFGTNPFSDINKLPSPRVFSTHLPFSILPDQIKNSGCRIVYITRHPADTLVSLWHFYHKLYDNGMPLELAFDGFCKGEVYYGPFFDHVLEYWKASEELENIFFMTYEELKEEPNRHVKELAEFLGCPMGSDEIEKIVHKCSYERLSNLDINKDGTKLHWSGRKFPDFFRQGVVGDSKNYLTPEMLDKLQNIAKAKWEGSGFKFKLLP